MKDNTTITPFRQPSSIIDPLTEIARDGARRLLMVEADGFVAMFSEDLLAEALLQSLLQFLAKGR